MNDDLSNNIETSGEETEDFDSSALAPLQIDYEDYRDELKDFDMTLEQQNQFLDTLWHIMRSFVELGWGLDSVQMFSSEKDEKARPDSVNAVEKNESTTSFNQAANAIVLKEEHHDS